MASGELSEVYKLAEQHLGVTWFEYEDPACGHIVRGTAMIDGDKHGWEEPTDKNLKEYAVRYAKQHILEKLMSDKQKKAGE
jgi:hypothetical protein